MDASEESRNFAPLYAGIMMLIMVLLAAPIYKAVSPALHQTSRGVATAIFGSSRVRGTASPPQRYAWHFDAGRSSFYRSDACTNEMLRRSLANSFMWSAVRTAAAIPRHRPRE